MTQLNKEVASIIFSLLVGYLTINLYAIKIKWKNREWSALFNHVILLLLGLLASLFMIIYYY